MKKIINELTKFGAVVLPNNIEIEFFNTSQYKMWKLLEDIRNEV